MTSRHRLGTSFAFIAVAALGFASFAIAAPQQAQKQPVQVAQASKEDLATGTWGFDKAHTEIDFTTIHMGLSKVHGNFSDFDGKVIADGHHPEKSSVEFTIKTASINTNNSARDNHLKSKDFFEVEKYPEITFKSTKIAKRKGGFVATGTLTMHGVSKEINIPFTVTGPIKSMDQKYHAAVDAELVIDRKDYGLTWNALIEGTKAVSDEVNITLSLDLIKQG